jgi:hypothetical protein
MVQNISLHPGSTALKNSPKPTNTDNTKPPTNPTPSTAAAAHLQHRLHRPHDKRERHENHRDRDPQLGEHHIDAQLREEAAEDAVVVVDGGEGEAGDRGGERKGEVDGGVDPLLAFGGMRGWGGVL